MKSITLYFGAGMAVACLSAFSETRVLVVREKSCVDEWRVTDDCRWVKKGTWLACGTDLKGPHSIAAADGIVYVGDSRGDAEETPSERARKVSRVPRDLRRRAAGVRRAEACRRAAIRFGRGRRRNAKRSRPSRRRQG